MRDADSDEMLGRARDDFSAYYTAANAADEQVMDSLILCHAALLSLLNTPRMRVLPPIRAEMERISDALDQLFASLREAVRGSDTFRSLTAQQQSGIESRLFRIQVPLTL